jgi:DNA-binding transcriptional LysR family regulator
MDLDLRKLRSFVAVANRLSFVAAAAELHLTQPALSRQIQSLEKELGVSLLIRDRRGTALTTAGRQLLEDARPLLNSAVGLERRVRAAARGELRFTIGFMPGVPTTDLVREFASLAPQLTIDAVYTPMLDQEDYLLDGRVDVCFVRLPLASRAIESIPILEEPRVAVVPRSSPLADDASTDLERLRVHPLVDEVDTVHGWRGDALPLRRPFTTVEDRLEAVASGVGCAILPAGVAHFYRRDDVVILPIESIRPVTVAVAYLRQRTMPQVAQFAELAHERLGARAG